MKHIILYLLFIAVAAAGCQSTQAYLPQPETSKYFHTRSAGFLMNVEEGDVASTYYLSLEIRQPLEQDGYLEVVFENPQNEEAPIVAGAPLKARQTIVDIQSPEIDGLRKSGIYDVEICLYTGADKEVLLGRHAQVVSAIHSESSIQKLSKK